jgi:hypothetical protein
MEDIEPQLLLLMQQKDLSSLTRIHLPVRSRRACKPGGCVGQQWEEDISTASTAASRPSPTRLLPPPFLTYTTSPAVHCLGCLPAGVSLFLHYLRFTLSLARMIFEVAYLCAADGCSLSSRSPLTSYDNSPTTYLGLGYKSPLVSSSPPLVHVLCAIWSPSF